MQVTILYIIIIKQWSLYQLIKSSLNCLKQNVENGKYLIKLNNYLFTTNCKLHELYVHYQ